MRGRPRKYKVNWKRLKTLGECDRGHEAEWEECSDHTGVYTVRCKCGVFYVDVVRNMELS